MQTMLRWLKKPLSVLGRSKNIANPTTKCASHVAVTDVITTSNSDDIGRYYDAKAEEKFKDGLYQAVRQLGTGTYSRVWLAKDLQ